MSPNKAVKKAKIDRHGIEPGACPVKKIRKRNNEVVPFDVNRIIDAIFRAAQAVGGQDRSIAERLAVIVINTLARKHGSRCVPTVEQVQDVVEKVLIENGHAATAKAFILYRSQHARYRENRNTFLKIQDTINEYVNKNDWRTQENSNTDYSFSGLMLHTSGKVIANYILNDFYHKDVAEAHTKGYIHIHDLAQGVVGYCAGWSLKNLLVKGFGGVPNKINCKPARHFDVLIHQMINFIGTMQMEFAGAQAFSSVDTYLAPFVRADKLTFEQVKQGLQHLVFSLNVPSRWGSQAPFSNLTFDWNVPEYMKDEPAVVGGEELDTTYGDYQHEMDMINQAFLEVMNEGDASGRIFTFPIPTYNLTKSWNWDDPRTERLFEVTAKYGIPYFQNYIGSDLDPSSIRAMCCRLNLNQVELLSRPGGMWAMGDSTGSIGVVTINMSRLAYLAKDKEEFFSMLHYYMALARNSLEEKRKMVNWNLKNGLMPYTKVYLGHFNNHFSTIGLCGMNEACMNFLGEGIITEEGRNFTVETLQFMKEVLKEFQIETGNLYNLEASPAESTGYRFAMIDKAEYPDIYTMGDSNTPYLTNSTQLNVDATGDLWEALEHQDMIQPLYTGGTIFHTYLGERLPDASTCKSLVRRIAENTRLPYFSITPTFSICHTHGYIEGEQPTCPTCREITEVYSRVVGYFRPVRNWNAGKKSEYKNRVPFQHDTGLWSDASEQSEGENKRCLRGWTENGESGKHTAPYTHIIKGTARGAGLAPASSAEDDLAQNETGS